MLNHVEEVNRAVHAGSAAVSPVVASWARSSKLHSLSPENDVLPERVEDASLRRQREALGRLIEAAQTSLDEVFVLVGHAGCSVVLANSDGVVLERRGKVADDGTFSNWGLWTGAIWSEASQGTNAIGTAIEYYVVYCGSCDERRGDRRSKGFRTFSGYCFVFRGRSICESSAVAIDEKPIWGNS